MYKSLNIGGIPVDAEWQRVACVLLKVPFHGPNHVQAGSPIHALTPPTRKVGITGDGNCMFRAISYIVTGSEDCHLGVRVAVVNYMCELHVRYRTFSDSKQPAGRVHNGRVH